MGVVDVKKIIQELIVPDLQEIKSGIKILNNRMDSFEREIDARFTAIDKRLDSLERELTTAIDIHERLASLEAKIGR